MYELVPLPWKGNFIGEIIWNPDFMWQRWNGESWEDYDFDSDENESQEGVFEIPEE